MEGNTRLLAEPEGQTNGYQKSNYVSDHNTPQIENDNNNNNNDNQKLSKSQKVTFGICFFLVWYFIGGGIFICLVYLITGVIALPFSLCCKGADDMSPSKLNYLLNLLIVCLQVILSLLVISNDF